LFSRYLAPVPDFDVQTIGSGPRVVLVHGSVGNGRATWDALRPLAGRFELAIVNRPGYPPNPPQERLDFEQQAAEIGQIVGPRDHLVGHSYGGVISLLIASRQPVRSLTVNEPPAFGVARGDPAVEELLNAFEDAPSDPRGYLEFFLPLVRSNMTVPDPLPPPLEAGAHSIPRAPGYGETLAAFLDSA
jgi:pimeloyl-ACP methyl ester carboxylesterase